MIYSIALCVLLAAVGVFGQVDKAAFEKAKFTVTFTAPNKVTITSNKFNDKQKLIAYHVVASKEVTAPTVGTINTPDITADPWKGEMTDSSFAKGKTIYYWVRMQTSDNPPLGFNSPTQSATL